jgi:hypothetical protein
MMIGLAGRMALASAAMRRFRHSRTMRATMQLARRGTTRDHYRKMICLEEFVVHEPYLLQAAILQVRQCLRHDFVLGEFIDRDVHFGLR